MSVNAMTEEYEHIELFGKPALFTNARVDTHTVPDGWHVYDLRGSDNDPGSPCTLEILVVVNHAGSIVVPEPIPFRIIRTTVRLVMRWIFSAMRSHSRNFANSMG